jgi:adenylate cyclase
MLKLARQTRDPTFSLNSHMAAGLSLFYLGEVRAAHMHLEKSSSRYHLDRYRFKAPVYGWDPGIVVACYKAKTYWLLGYPDKAEQTAKKALRIAGELSSPFHSALANGLLATYHSYRRDANEALRAAETTIRISTEGGFNHWLALGTLMKGSALIGKGYSSEGNRYLQEGIARWKTMGAEMAMPTFLALQADGYMTAEQHQKALACIEEGLAISKKNSESYYDAELYRLKGELLSRSTKRNTRSDNVKNAEEILLRAVQLARELKTKSLELRATTSLARLWQTMGKEKEARKALAKICGWFAEGFDTADLKSAKELLSELSWSRTP